MRESSTELLKPAPESERIRARQILRILRQTLQVRDQDFATLVVANDSHDPFRVLVVTILSQSCTDIAALRAYRNLDRQIGVTAAALERASAREIQGAIKVAGLHRQKARAIRRLAQMVEEEYSLNFAGVLNGELEEVRSRLQQFPKVGPKTADVLLSVFGRSTISVDTHVNRVSKRLGMVPQNAKYEQVRAVLMQLFKEDDYRSIPLLFMAHGRQVCKAITPRCHSCPVEMLCPYPKKNL